MKHRRLPVKLLFPGRRFFRKPDRSSEAGWTLAELLIVVVIIAILAVSLLLVNWKRNIYRAQDAHRKADLASIRRGFEEYYNDHECYPSTTILDTCGGNGLQPYIARIPCDPVSREPYKYEPDSTSALCAGNRICAKLQDVNDPDIVAIGCDGIAGCGWGPGWNYCLAAGTTVTSAGYNSYISQAPTPSPTPWYNGPYACRPGTLSGNVVVAPGTCNNVGDPAAYGCPVAYSENDCRAECGVQANWCLQ